MRRAAAAAVVLFAGAAPAADVTGYAESRSGFSRARSAGLLPTNDLPQFTELIEANAQVRHAYRERGFVYGDVSLISQLGSSYRGADAEGNEIVVEDHEVKSVQPLVSLNEL